MKEKILVLSILTFLSFSCENSTNPPSKENHFPQLDTSNYGDIILTFVDYDIIQITHQLGLDLESEKVSQIEIGKKKNDIFYEIAVFPFLYNSETEIYQIRFKLTVALDQEAVWFPLTIRYVEDKSYTDVDTLIGLFKYPYTSTSVFSDLLDLGYRDLQDVARNDSLLFFHGWNSDGLHEYNLINKEVSHFLFYYGGSHITANSKYVFCDINHETIVRFNLVTNVPDITFPEFSNINNIMGIAVNDSQLLALICSNGLSSNYLKKLTFDGIAIDSVSYGKDTYFMAVKDSIIYSKDYVDIGDYQISRFNMKTGNFLPNLKSPAKDIGGMEIYNDTLYYCDEWKRIVGMVPVVDLIPVE